MQGYRQRRILLDIWFFRMGRVKHLSTWQKFEYIEFGCVCRSEKHVCDFLKTILDQWLSSSPMLQNFYRFNVYIFMLTNEIRPYKSYADHRKQTWDTHSVTQVSVLDVEARRFHGTECRFNLPAFLYVATPSSGRLKQIRIWSSGIPSEFLIRLPAR